MIIDTVTGKELSIPNYQTLAIDHVPDGVYLYMGNNYVFMTLPQWEEFKDMVLPF